MILSFDFFRVNNTQARNRARWYRFRAKIVDIARTSLTDNFSLVGFGPRKGKARDVFANQSKHRVFMNLPAIMKCVRDISQSLRATRIRRKNAKREKNSLRMKNVLEIQFYKTSRRLRRDITSRSRKNVLGLQIHVLHSITKCGRTRDF